MWISLIIAQKIGNNYASCYLKDTKKLQFIKKMHGVKFYVIDKNFYHIELKKLI